MQRIDMTDGAMVGRVGSTRVLPSEPACAHPCGATLLICPIHIDFFVKSVRKYINVSRTHLLYAPNNS